MAVDADDGTGGAGPIRSVLIVGGGTAGWMAAAALARDLRGLGIRIELIESDAIGTIGVGEATIPTLRRFYARLGLSDATVMAATHATAKLGIGFEGWGEAGRDFLHPFGLYGADYDGLAFHQLWLARKIGGGAETLDQYSLGAMLAKAGRMRLPDPAATLDFGRFDWALHLDATAFAKLLRDYAEASGVTRIEGRIDRVEHQDGRVRAVHLDDGRAFGADLFIDCSGFRSLLLGDALGVEFEDWSQWLPANAAVAVQSASAGDPPPYTRAIAHRAGWRWRIPLRHRAGNGIVYSTRHMSEDEATATLLADLPGEALTNPLSIPFRSGRRRRVWSGNVVGLGLAAGFLEPLESTSIALIENGITRLLSRFPDRDFDPALIDAYNDTSGHEMERVRDFIILHYALNRRDEPFWTECRAMSLPEPLTRKLALWDARGDFLPYRWEMFHASSWLAIYLGLGRLPRTLDPRVAAVPSELLGEGLDRIRALIEEQVARTPTHADFLKGMTA